MSEKRCAFYVSEYEKVQNMPEGTIVRAILAEGSAWAKMECGVITMAEFAEQFSEQASHQVHILTLYFGLLKMLLQKEPVFQAWHQRPLYTKHCCTPNTAIHQPLYTHHCYTPKPKHYTPNTTIHQTPL